ncbi:hypothetical protein I7F13_05035 [Sinorhizobium meliloti]|uniref:hypothetical protein n=1 Tax=Rhizobium meliloti TaxID=382 RepID=UPI000FDC8899|nr:hypothetical protein [Sinorhizobium meliloti]MDE3821795.1 hypothetical protein [Sinorhizobium meliloti]RVM47216.1 hypothetical protein CN127_18895 [Sinorhizobium meliloti]RVN75544.1 hypothetical protein CN106_00880 [Sinorhizobium meliloti]
MRIGFTESEYARVRDWLVAAIDTNPDVISEGTLLEKLRFNEWQLLTTENAACVLQLCEHEGEKIANVILLGGKRNGSLREIMGTHVVLCDFLRERKFTKLVGTPRKEWHQFLKKNGFKQQENEFIKELI